MKTQLFLICLVLTMYVGFAQTKQIDKLSPQKPSGWADNKDGSITSLEELLWLSETVEAWDENWVLEANIDASETITWNEGLGFSPIGDSPTEFGVRQQIPFTGSFDGQGFEIFNLYINRPDEPYVGFFGQVSNGVIQNIRLTQNNTEGYRYVGGLIGYAHDGTIVTNSFLSGEVSGYEKIGGLIGQNYQGIEIDSCHSSGSVSGEHWVGGLVADNYSHSNISNCYSTSEISGIDWLGGISGANRWYSNIENSYSTGNVTGTDEFIGGFVGNNDDAVISNCFSSGASIGFRRIGGLVGESLQGENPDAGLFRCYATGEVSGDDFIGGLVGRSYSYIINCYFDIETTGTTIGVGNPDAGQFPTGLSTDSFANENNFLTWDFENTWMILINGQVSEALRPYLYWQITEFYTLDFIAANGGTIEGVTNQTVTPGSTSLPVMAVEDVGYTFIEWQDADGITFSEEPSLIVENINSDNTFTAIFDLESGSQELVSYEPSGFYPNPAKSTITVETNIPSILRITDLDGNILKEVPISSKDVVDIRFLNIGVYLLSYNTSKGPVHKKLIKQ